MIDLDITGTTGFLEKPDMAAARAAAVRMAALPMSGWLSLPETAMRELPRLLDAGRRISERSDALVVIGAGGSSLGARAFIEAAPSRGGVREVYFAGDNLSGAYMSRLVKTLEGRELSVVVTSKSGTTTEPAAALRVFLELLRERYGERFADRLFVVAGEGRSPLRDYAQSRGCELFYIPEGVGGRYSALTAAGLLPAAARGLDIGEILRGAREQAERGDEAALLYAAARQALYASGFRTELFASFEPSARALGEWWKQLFGESEGKGGGGIFPASVSFTGDLHSMGQYIQEGRRDIFETIIAFRGGADDMAIPANREFDDGFAFLDGASMNGVNETARQAVKAAHIQGGTPVIELQLPELGEYALGAAMYFFEYACAVSACIAGVNPFDQPGVEAYKKIMLRELRKR
ncbi:MAG: glucose-6-phosphate isomerase [Oscillospiraceae bacterium]|jgi:glucose-6-phosphate isomerase|nr:glucose-6-phosphate isomerase [Oscillospiraceae bacterium]